MSGGTMTSAVGAALYRAADVNRRPGEVLEALPFDIDLIVARNQIYKLVASSIAGHGDPSAGGRDVGEDYLGARNHRASRVSDNADE
jgi:hypothetical protein